MPRSRDLETICLKCLRKEPSHRYASAGELADDLGRFLRGEPIGARPVSVSERAFKWVRRRPAVAALLLLGLLSVLGFSAGMIWHFDTQRAEIQRGDLARDSAREQEIIADTQRQRAEEGERADRRSVYARDMNFVQQDWESARIEHMREMLQRHLPPPGALDVRGFEWHYWQRLAHSDRRTLTGHTTAVRWIACAPDGKTFASAAIGGREHAVRLWETAGGRDLGVLARLRRPVSAAAFADGGRAMVLGSLLGEIQVWDVATRRMSKALSARGPWAIMALAVVPNQPVAAIARGDADGVVLIWDLDAPALRHILRGHEKMVWTVAFSADGRRVASGGDDGIVRLWDPKAGELLASYRGHQGTVMSVAFAPGGGTLASAGWDGTVRLWNLAAGKPLAVLNGHTRTVWSVQFSPDGRSLVSAGDDATLRVWDVATGLSRFVHKGHIGTVHCAAFTPDGRLIVSGGADRLIKLWDAEHGPDDFTWKGHDQAVAEVAFAPDGTWLATGSLDGTVKLWEPAGRRLADLPTYPHAIQRSGDLPGRQVSRRGLPG